MVIPLDHHLSPTDPVDPDAQHCLALISEDLCIAVKLRSILLEAGSRVASVSFSDDDRYSIHALEVWPFD